MQLDSGQWIVIGICAVLIAGYAYGYNANRKLAEQVIGWLHTGLKRWGQLTAGGRLGGMATGGRLNIKNATAFFQNIEIIFWLMPRENLLFWLYDLLRGRHDLLVLKFSLRTPPPKDTAIEAGRRIDRDFRKALEAITGPTEESKAGGLSFVQRGKSNTAADHAVQFLEKYQGLVTRLSVYRQNPQVTIQIRLNPLLGYSAEEYFSSIQELFQFGKQEKD
jgi:hypothetical protein